MIKAAHVSDLHFSKVYPEAERALQKELTAGNYRLIIISGDITQRAFAGQFRRAAHFIRDLHMPVLVIPGNHDITNINLIRRIINPFKYYKRYISEDLDQVYEDDDILAVGINSAKRYPIRNGKISAEQIARAAERFKKSTAGFKLLVTHHPFIRPPHGSYRHIVKGAGMTIKGLKDCGVSLILSGHYHTAYFGSIKNHFPGITRDIITSQAGTAVSRRTRTDGNTINIIKIENDEFSLTSKGFLQNQFREIETVRFKFSETELVPILAEEVSGEAGPSGD
ncbi:MAG: metallophosphoesterase family protein [Spirochaetia bacterium]